ncbi:MAG: beta-N-acetylhexosaminidase [Parachlamydiaceae bacterium]|nr:beta-N-acetylhexosaminidase [Parachlamydiaceae bacterium]
MSRKLKIFAFSCLYVLPCFGLLPLENLSLEEKVGQILMVNFQGEVPNEDAKALIQEIKVGGIVYYNWANGLNSPEQVKKLSLGLQELSQENSHLIPLLIASDQEGGIVTRLSQGFTVFPGNRALGETGDSNLAAEAAFAMGQEMQAVGVNMNFAPVVDINSNPRNPVIGIRAFGEHPEKVLAFGNKALNGYHAAGIITTLKHFPGHGDVEVDSHEALPVINKNLDELERTELLPFTKLASHADVIMTAHLLVPALDSENCSTLSTKTLTYLKNTIGFHGVIISDSLVMEGVLKKCETIDEAAIQAFNAGCDILLLGGKLLMKDHTSLELSVGDIRRIHSHLVKAVRSGRISEARLNESIQKILELKAKYLGAKISKLSTFDQTAHLKLAQKIASRSLKVIKNTDTGPLHNKKILVLAPQLLQENLQRTTLFKKHTQMPTYFFKSLAPTSQELDEVKILLQEADGFLIYSYNAWKNPLQSALIHSVLETKKPGFLIVTRDPLDAQLFPNAHTVFLTFSPTLPSLQAVCDKLESFLLNGYVDPLL